MVIVKIEGLDKPSSLSSEQSHQQPAIKIAGFYTKFKPRQLHLAVRMLPTSSVLSATSKLCFEQPTASFLVCSLIFIEY